MENTGITKDFAAQQSKRNVKALRVASLSAAILVPLFWILDWYVIPTHLYATFILRTFCTAFSLSLFLASYFARKWVRKNVLILSMVLPILLVWSIAIMCWLHDGLESPYYAGMNLVILVSGFVFSWNHTQAAVIYVLSYVFYIAPAALGILTINNFSLMLSNQFFYLSTIILTFASQRHRVSLEEREFLHFKQLRKVLEKVQRLAITDELTGINNRRHLIMLAERELNRCRRYGRPCTAIMIDIDNFKKVNDTHGHQVGDQVIQSVANRITKSIRSVEVFGRYGGEEFLIIVPELDGESCTRLVAERIRSAVHSKPLSTSIGDLNVTVSIGVYGELYKAKQQQKSSDLTHLISKADTALYFAKSRGKNKVVLWSPEVAAETDKEVA